METTRQIREQNLIEIARLRGGVISKGDVILFRKIAHRLHSLDVASCNWGLTERQEKRVTRLEERANTTALMYGLIAYHQPDPRGWSLYLLDKSEQHPEANYYPEGLGVCPH